MGPAVDRADSGSLLLALRFLPSPLSGALRECQALEDLVLNACPSLGGGLSRDRPGSVLATPGHVRGLRRASSPGVCLWRPCSLEVVAPPEFPLPDFWVLPPKICACCFPFSLTVLRLCVIFVVLELPPVTYVITQSVANGLKKARTDPTRLHTHLRF